MRVLMGRHCNLTIANRRPPTHTDTHTSSGGEVSPAPQIAGRPGTVR